MNRRTNQGSVCWRREGRVVWRKRLVILLSLVFLVLAHISKLRATPQLDQLGLLPPASSDTGSRVDQIRRALSSRDFKQMRNAVNELIRFDPHNWKGYFWQGFLDLQLQDGDDSVRSLRKAEALDANSSVLKLLAIAYYTLRQYHLFILTMQGAIQKNPEDFAPYYYLGRYYVSTEASDFGKAATYFQKALRRNPRHALSWYYLGYCYEVRRKLADAEIDYKRSMKLAGDAPDNFALPYEGMARLRLLESKPSDALSYAKKAVELDPNDAASRTILAEVYEALGQRADAIPEWDRVTELDQADAVPYYHLFQIYAATGMKDKASHALANFKRLVAIYGSQ